MKSALTILLLVSLASIAIFGFLAMNHGASHFCIAALANGLDCLGDNSFSSLLFHANAYKSFSNAVFNAEFLRTSAIVLLIIGISFAFLFPDSSSRLPLSQFRYQKISGFFLSIAKKCFSYWIALHEKRDPSLVF